MGVLSEHHPQSMHMLGMHGAAYANYGTLVFTCCELRSNVAAQRGVLQYEAAVELAQPVASRSRRRRLRPARAAAGALL